MNEDSLKSQFPRYDQHMSTVAVLALDVFWICTACRY